MRQFIPLTSIVFMFTGCTTYQYMTVSGKNIRQNERQEFVVENDSIRVKYNFSGEDAPVNVEVTNKLDRPVYVDWSRSALIINDKAISYVPGSVPISGSVSSISSGLGRGLTGYRSSASYGEFSGSVTVPQEMDFIPPGSYKARTPLGVTNIFYPHAKEGAFWQKVYLTSTYTARVKARKFTDSVSPLTFSSYLTLFVEGEPDKPVVFNHSFYISEIWTTTIPPHNFRFMMDREGNHFYVSTTNAFGHIAGGFGIVAGLAVLRYAEVKAQEYHERQNYKRQY